MFAGYAVHAEKNRFANVAIIDYKLFGTYFVALNRRPRCVINERSITEITGKQRFDLVTGER